MEFSSYHFTYSELPAGGSGSALDTMSTVRLPSTCIFRSAPKSLKTSSFVKTQNSLGFMSISKTFGLKANSGFRASAMAVYKIKLVTPEGEEHEFEAPDDCCILDSAEDADSCRAGICSTCCWKLESGFVDQSEGSFLEEDQMKDGYVLTCVSFPAADCVIHTHKETDLY